MVRRLRIGVLASVASLTLAACGGSGSNVATLPPPPVVVSPPSSPTNTLISNLVANERFHSSSTTLNTDVALANATVGTTTSSRDDISVQYDAVSNSYALTTAGRSARFDAADRSPARFEGEQRYRNADGEYLTLVTYPYLSDLPNTYVGLGYWQANSIAGDTQRTTLTAFTYGFDTAQASLPRTGSANFQTDVLGFLAVPGKELSMIQGLGGFIVDFALGKYRTIAYVSEMAVLTNNGVTGSLILQSGGDVDSAGKFGGILTYRGSENFLTGTLSGGFYGPGAAELGASFQASDGNAHLTGAFTGQRSNKTGTSEGVTNLALTDIIAPQRLFGSQVNLLRTKWDGRPGFTNLVGGVTVGTVDVAPNGVQQVGLTDGYNPRSADIVAGPANFTTYKTTIRGNPATISLYKVGPQNTELQLTYSSFVEWQAQTPTAIPDGSTGTTYDTRYLVYGVETPNGLLSARTGQASYSGVVYGTGASQRGDLYDVRGTSRFAVNFSAGTYSGELNLNGKSAQNEARDFGKWTFADRVVGGAMRQTELLGPSGRELGSYIYPRFYGPTGEEIGATFTARFEGAEDIDRVYMAGVTVAKKD